MKFLKEQMQKEDWKALMSGITYRKTGIDVELNVRLSSQSETYEASSMTTIATLPERIQTKL